MGKFLAIKSHQIRQALESTTRQYLVGHLARPQQLEYVDSEHLEVGITSYARYTEEKPHRHTEATEYQYILSGWTQYMDAESGEIFEYKKGDFFTIFPNTTYAQKSKAGTSILFIKVPSINDKHVEEETAEVLEWFAKGLKTIRKDYYHFDDAPKANSIVPAAAVAIFNEDNQILLLQRRDSGKWTMPGGTMELGESLLDCALREVREECGLDVNVVDVIGIYTDPGVRVEYSDGEVRQEFSIVYFASTRDHKISMNSESIAWRWISLEEVEKLPMAQSQKVRIADVKAYVENGRKRI